MQGEKLIGQHIDREWNIPKEGLVRHWKTDDKHFVDDVWGTEMMPNGNISYDELGYCGNTAAPFTGGKGYLEVPNTLAFRDGVDYTFNVFFKPYAKQGTVFCIGDTGSWHIAINIRSQHRIFASFYGWDENRFLKGKEPELGKWHMGTITHTLVDNKYVCAFYLNGEYVGEKSYANSIGRNPVPLFRLFNNYELSSAFNGYIDHFCIWERCLTEEEISEMAKGVQPCKWDVPVPEYVQQQPVFYAPLTENMESLTGQKATGPISTGVGNPLAEPQFLHGGMCNYSTDGGNSGYSWGYYRTTFMGNYSQFYTGNGFSVSSEIYPIEWNYDWKNYGVGGSVVYSYGLFELVVLSHKGDNTLFACFKDSTGKNIVGTTVIPYNQWSMITAVVDKGKVYVYVNGESDATGTTSGSTKPGDDYVYTVNPDFDYRNTTETQIQFKACQRNIRIYNRALSVEEVRKLAGIEDEAE